MDYLLKPFARERLRGGARRARASGWRDAASRRPAALARDGAAAGAPLERVVDARRRATCTSCRSSKIDYVEAQDDYVAFRTAGKSLLKEQTLAEVEAQLDPRALRAHPPLVPAERRSAGAGRAVRQGQPHRDARGRHEAAGEPRRVPAPATVALRRAGLTGCSHGIDEVRRGDRSVQLHREVRHAPVAQPGVAGPDADEPSGSPRFDRRGDRRLPVRLRAAGKACAPRSTARRP